MRVPRELRIVEDKRNASRANRFIITSKWLALWSAASIIVVLACYSVRPYVWLSDEFSALINSMNVIAYVLIIGLPVFMIPGIVFGTPSARERILARQESEKRTSRVFLQCLLEVYALTLVFSVAITVALFLGPLLIGTSIDYPRGTGVLMYLPPVLIATFTVSVLLASIGVLFAVVTDNIIISTTLGCAVTIALASMVGWNSIALYSSVTRGIAMLSPSNIARIFAGAISGYNPAPYATISDLFGFEAILSSILLSLAVLGLISFAGLLVSHRVFRFNMSNWSKTAEIRRIAQVWESELERQGVHTRIRRSLRIRRAAFAGFIIVFLTIAATGTAAYSDFVIDQTTVIFYRSPEGGAQIDLGDWYIFSCDVQPARYGQRNNLRYSCEVEDWGSAPEEVSVYYKMLNMSSSEFQNLNETSRRLLCSYRNRTRGSWGGFGGGWDLGYSHGLYTLVLKIVAAENETLQGFMYFSIELLQRPY